MSTEITKKVQQAIKDYEIIFLNNPRIFKIDKADQNLRIPDDFELINLDLDGLKLKVIKQDNTILWECHFNINGADHRDEAKLKGINDFETFETMLKDFKKLQALVNANPHIKPDIIYAGLTNNVMYNFLVKIAPQIVLDDINPPEDSLSTTSKGPGWREKYFLIDTQRFIDLMNQINSSSGFLDFFRSKKRSESS